MPNQVQLFFEFYDQIQSGIFVENEFLIQPENEAAHRKLTQFLSQKIYEESLLQSLILLGEKSCGKTHLLHDFAKKYPVEIVKHDDLKDFNSLNFLRLNSYYFLDDCDEISEEEILYLINSANEKKAFLLLVFNSQKKFLLPDLSSRIANRSQIEILAPSLESLRQIFIKNLSNRQIFLEESLIDFFCKNAARTYEAFNNLAKKIEFFCKESGEKLTINRAKSLI